MVTPDDVSEESVKEWVVRVTMVFENGSTETYDVGLSTDRLHEMQLGPWSGERFARYVRISLSPPRCQYLTALSGGLQCDLRAEHSGQHSVYRQWGEGEFPDAW